MTTRIAVLAICLGAACAPVAAQEAFPSRPITMIVPFAAGGTSYVIARLIGERMGEALGGRLDRTGARGARQA